MTVRQRGRLQCFKKLPNTKETDQCRHVSYLKLSFSPQVISKKDQLQCRMLYRIFSTRTGQKYSKKFSGMQILDTFVFGVFRRKLWKSDEVVFKGTNTGPQMSKYMQ